MSPLSWVSLASTETVGAGGQGRRQPGRSGFSGQAGSQEAEAAPLRAENARLLKAEKEWQLEREILRRAAQYFAKEMK